VAERTEAGSATLIPTLL
jgi:hypothetical protein